MIAKNIQRYKKMEIEKMVTRVCRIITCCLAIIFSCARGMDENKHVVVVGPTLKIDCHKLVHLNEQALKLYSDYQQGKVYESLKEAWYKSKNEKIEQCNEDIKRVDKSLKELTTNESNNLKHCDVDLSRLGWQWKLDATKALGCVGLSVCAFIGRRLFASTIPKKLNAFSLPIAIVPLIPCLYYGYQCVKSWQLFTNIDNWKNTTCKSNYSKSIQLFQKNRKADCDKRDALQKEIDPTNADSVEREIKKQSEVYYEQEEEKLFCGFDGILYPIIREHFAYQGDQFNGRDHIMKPLTNEDINLLLTIFSDGSREADYYEQKVEDYFRFNPVVQRFRGQEVGVCPTLSDFYDNEDNIVHTNCSVRLVHRILCYLLCHDHYCGYNSDDNQDDFWHPDDLWKKERFLKKHGPDAKANARKQYEQLKTTPLS
jgi:hypothetical protein